MPDDRSFHVLEAVVNRLDASPERPRRRWSAEAKARLVEESLKPGANVSRSRARLDWRARSCVAGGGMRSRAVRPGRSGIGSASPQSEGLPRRLVQAQLGGNRRFFPRSREICPGRAPRRQHLFQSWQREIERWICSQAFMDGARLPMSQLHKEDSGAAASLSPKGMRSVLS